MFRKFYKAQPSAFLNDREIIVPTGAVLGGGTSVNFQLYMRSQGLDWDKFDMPGWTGKDMIPLINKLETFHPNDEGIDQSMHGHDGPIHVSDGGFRGIEGEEGYREAVKSLGYNIVPDIQDFKTVGSFAVGLLLSKVMNG
jgi:alcohol oxidase